MPLQLISPPALEPITLADARAHLKVESDADDALITSLIAAARARAEWHTARAFITQDWILWLDRWPNRNCIEIPLSPSQAITHLKTYAEDDTETVLDANLFSVDTASPHARVLLHQPLPTPLRALNAIALHFTAGYGDTADSVPEPIRTAILHIIADLYTNRGDAHLEPPQSALALLAPYRSLKL